MEFPRLKRILTDPDEFLSNGQLKSLSMELLELIPMEGIEGLPLDSEQIIEVVLRVPLTRLLSTPSRRTPKTHQTGRQ